MGKSFSIPQPGPLDSQRGETFSALVALMRRLLGPDGCPWDREQSIESLRGFLLEETCEALDAIDTGDRHQLQEELGDVALQIAFLSELARGEKAFGPDDVMCGIVGKLVRRHPHVFADTEVESSSEVSRNWEAIKAREKAARPLLDNIPRALPALTGAQRVSARVATVGFDWPDAQGSRAKVSEEIAELDEALTTGDRVRIEAELGDVLFALTNLARHYGLDAEAALRQTTDRFRDRFAHVEARVREARGDWPRNDDGKPTSGLSLGELDGYWEEAKASKP